jgi:GntR family transcriptional repressor for pyruvate dehydrogenase complex
VGEIVDAIRRDIAGGRLAPGDRLPTESSLVERFDVSRSVVREALSRLQAAGQVETRHGIGTFVLPPASTDNFRIPAQALATMQDVIAVLELRIGLECEAAGLAAERRSASDLAAMTDALATFATAIAEGGDALSADFRFHMAVAAATGNRHYVELMAYLGTMSIPRARIGTPESSPLGRIGYLQRVLAEHRRIHEAIRDGDPQRAKRAMRAHLGNSRDRLKR